MDAKTIEIIVQSIGALGILASVISFQCKKHSSILFFRTMNEMLFAVQYLLLGAYTGMAANLVGSLRNTIFSHQISHKKSTKVSSAVFCALFVVFGIVTWQGAKSLLIIFAKILSTLAYGNKNTTVVRSTILITSSSWLIYNLSVFSIAGVLCEAFTLVSLFAGIIRLDLLPAIKKRKAEREEPK